MATSTPPESDFWAKTARSKIGEPAVKSIKVGDEVPEEEFDRDRFNRGGGRRRLGEVQGEILDLIGHLVDAGDEAISQRIRPSAFNFPRPAA